MSFARRTRQLFLTLAVAIGALAAASPVAAADTYTATIVNLGPSGEQTLKLDTDGNHIDAHDGDLLQSQQDGSWWWYGTSYDCGFGLNTAGTSWCGVKVYRSVDLMQWHDMGLMVAPDATWTARCSYPLYGCFRPHVVWNASTGLYVMWINTYDTTYGFRVLTSPTPGGPWTEQAPPTLAHPSGGDEDLFVDTDGTGYIAYTDIARNHTIVIERLTADYLTGTGTAVDATGTGVEAPSLVKHGSTYYLVYGPTCAYCSSSETRVATASTPLGTWSSPTVLNSTSCGGQASWVADVNGTLVYASDLWQGGAANQALAKYFWTPLTFSGATMQSFTCAQSVSVTMSGTQTWEAPPVGLDQSAGDYGWKTWCDVSATFSRLQTFVPARNGVLSGVGVMSFRGSTAPNGPLLIEVRRVSPTLTPIGPVLATGSFPTVGRSPTLQRFNPNVPVRAGGRYALVIRSTSTAGCYGMAYNDLSTYALGTAAYKWTGAWTGETNRSLSFVTEVT